MRLTIGKSIPPFMASCVYKIVQERNAERVMRDGVYISDLDCIWSAATVPKTLLDASFFDLRDDVQAWLDEEVPKGAYRYVPEVGAIGFFDPDDAMTFRMRWL